MIWFVLIVAFIYLIYRVNELEVRIHKLQNPEPKPQLKIHPEPQPEVSKSFIPTPTEPVVASVVETPKEHIQTKHEDHDWEMKLGGKFFSVIGSIAVLFGIAFFLKYAFDNNLISETGRIILGFIGGAVVIGIGQLAAKKYDLYGQILSGLGLAIFYLTLFAGFNFYHLFPQGVAFIGMIITTGIGIGLSIRHDSQPLAGFAQFGGFITPFLLANGINNPHALFSYIFFLNSGVLALSILKPWQSLNLGSLVGTAIVYSSWFATFYHPNQFNVAFGYISLFFILFLTISLIQYFVQKSPSDQRALSILTLNTIFYYIVSYATINQLHPSWMGPFTFILGGVYLILGLMTIKPQGNADYYHQFLFGLSFILFFVGIPIQFEKFIISIGWAAEALVLIILGFKMQARYTRYLAHCIFVVATLYTLAYSASHDVTLAWANPRMISSLMIAAALLIAAVIYWAKKSEADSVQTTAGFAPKNEFMEAVTALVLQAYILLLFVISLEVINIHKEYLLPIIWSVMALIVGFVGLEIKNLILRWATYLTFGAVAIRLLFYDSIVNIVTHTPLFNTRVLAFVFSFAIIAILLSLYGKRKLELSAEEQDIVLPVLFFGNNILMLSLIGLEISDYYNHKATVNKIGVRQYQGMKNITLSISWLLYASINLVLGIISKQQPLRIFALLLFGVVIVKVFLYDTVSLNNLYRFVSYITLGIILLFAGYLYNRYKDRIIQFIKAT